VNSVSRKNSVMDEQLVLFNKYHLSFNNFLLGVKSISCKHRSKFPSSNLEPAPDEVMKDEEQHQNKGLGSSKILSKFDFLKF
jgi:hypothetical protein